VTQFSFEQAVEKIRESDARFSPAAYDFIRRCLDHSIQRLGRKDEKTPSHVKGKELLEGFRHLALQEFGPMAKTVLNEWGIQNCSQVGDIVFQLVQYGILGKSETDQPDDFQEIWTFTEAFESPFQPKIMVLRRRSPQRKISPRQKGARDRKSRSSSKLKKA
jgi:uncharacterized repeat protein (TIGR04138 family)